MPRWPIMETKKQSPESDFSRESPVKTKSRIFLSQIQTFQKILHPMSMFFCEKQNSRKSRTSKCNWRDINICLRDFIVKLFIPRLKVSNTFHLTKGQLMRATARWVRTYNVKNQSNHPFQGHFLQKRYLYEHIYKLLRDFIVKLFKTGSKLPQTFHMTKG